MTAHILHGGPADGREVDIPDGRQMWIVPDYQPDPRVWESLPADPVADLLYVHHLYERRTVVSRHGRLNLYRDVFCYTRTYDA